MSIKRLTKQSIQFYNKLNTFGFNLVPIKEIQDGYKPYISWKKYEIEPQSKDLINRWDANEDVTSFALVTGFNDVECIDIDTKIFTSVKEKQDFWKEYLNLLISHIDNFIDKVVIIETKSGGYHIIYKTSIKDGNKKIAKPKGYKEALIESRGVGGFIFLHDKTINKKKYHEIDYISDAERNLIWDISRTYNYEEPKKIDLPTKKTFKQDGVSPWDDYAQKNTILDVCSDEFDIMSKGKNSILIRRKGAKSAHSGYIFDNSGKMFLFSTGTLYPNEQPLNSFDVYAYKHHNGDYKNATKQAYQDGYGARYEVETVTYDLPKRISDLEFPLHIFPANVQHYINECSSKLNASPDFMGSAFLWLTSTLLGNTLKIQVKKGWIDSPIVWISVIGKAGVGKTPDLDLIVKPLNKLNEQEIVKYNKRYSEFKTYESLSKEDKEINETLEQPKRKQFIVDDITIEGLVQLHEESPKSIGVYKDELAGFFKDMNKYREGSDLQFWLTTWSGKSYNVNRKTSGDSFLKKPFLPILGGIQPEIFETFQTQENKHNGFMDRMLFCNPNKKAQYPSIDEISTETLQAYQDYVFRIKEIVDTDLTELDDDGDINPFIVGFTEDAKKEFRKYHCELVDKQESENELDYFRGVFAKQITYIPRFSLIIAFLKSLERDELIQEVTLSDVKAAKEVSDYYIKMTKNNKTDNDLTKQIADVIANCKTNKDKVLTLVNKFPKLSKTTIAETVGISRQTVHNLTK